MFRPESRVGVICAAHGCAEEVWQLNEPGTAGRPRIYCSERCRNREAKRRYRARRRKSAFVRCRRCGAGMRMRLDYDAVARVYNAHPERLPLREPQSGEHLG
jgi:hypothetical protein